MILFVVLLIAWIGGFTVFHVAGGSFIGHLVTGDFIDSAFCHGCVDGLMICVCSEKPHSRWLRGFINIERVYCCRNRLPSSRP